MSENRRLVDPDTGRTNCACAGGCHVVSTTEATACSAATGGLTCRTSFLRILDTGRNVKNIGHTVHYSRLQHKVKQHLAYLNGRSGNTRNFHMGATAQGAWGLSPHSPASSKGEAPVGGLWSPPEAEAVCKRCLQILTGTETIKS